jgi:purine/pyrimidine-nucleoside phosphorylase
MPQPTEFANVTAVAKANVFFEGNVVSHTLRMADGSKKTLGLIYPGQYHFDTQQPERMDITAGSCRVRLAGQESWQQHGPGSSFKVAAGSGFDIAVESGIAEYVCSFG